MKLHALFLLLAIFVSLLSVATFASEGAEGEGEKKSKPPEKPTPDSAVSVIMQLPEVQKWESRIDSGKDGAKLSVWGESIVVVNDEVKCWGVVVGKTTSFGTNVLKRFCVTQFGREVLVETRKEENLDETKLIPYETWQKDCHPTAFSPGSC